MKVDKGLIETIQGGPRTYTVVIMYPENPSPNFIVFNLNKEPNSTGFIEIFRSNY